MLVLLSARTYTFRFNEVDRALLGLRESDYMVAENKDADMNSIKGYYVFAHVMPGYFLHRRHVFLIRTILL